jgi:hypothetical protein
MNSFGVDKAVTFRQPSTANLMIDSLDRPGAVDVSGFIIANPWAFQITKKQALQNGFFTRIATTEVVLEWAQPNISNLIGNNTVTWDLSGTGGNTYSNTVTVTVANGFFNVAQAATQICKLFNDLSGTTGMIFGTATYAPTNSAVIASVGGVWRVTVGTLLGRQIGLPDGLNDAYSAIHSLVSPDLRPYRYLDFTSSQLTLCQDVKDTSTAIIERDVLCRWYFAFDDPPTYDTLGFPILMGYTPFFLRRLYNPPKQIKWDTIQSFGNLAFEVFGTTILDETEPVYYSNVYKSNWLMTLQLSEN